MPKVIVLGAGVCGLASAMMLARDGHGVTVLERDPAPVPETPEAAWERWERRGVAQFRRAHILVARGRHVLDAELPDVRDDELVMLTARRPVVEQVVARAEGSHGSPSSRCRPTPARGP